MYASGLVFIREPVCLSTGFSEGYLFLRVNDLVLRSLGIRRGNITRERRKISLIAWASQMGKKPGRK